MMSVAFNITKALIYYNIFVLLLLNYVENRDHRTKDLFVKFFCYKLIGCPPNGAKVCGFDDNDSTLAVFEDICTMYKANCKSAGMFQEVDMIVCETQKAYEAQHQNDTFEFIHVSTEASSTLKDMEYHWLPSIWKPRIHKDYDEEVGRDTKYL